jgi:hypothetical protein
MQAYKPDPVPDKSGSYHLSVLGFATGIHQPTHYASLTTLSEQLIACADVTYLAFQPIRFTMRSKSLSIPVGSYSAFSLSPP